MAKPTTARKAVGLVVTGLPIWGAASSASNGIDASEWWGLVALLAGAFMVWYLPNDPLTPPAPWAPPDHPTS